MRCGVSPIVIRTRSSCLIGGEKEMAKSYQRETCHVIMAAKQTNIMYVYSRQKVNVVYTVYDYILLLCHYDGAIGVDLEIQSRALV